MTETLKRDHEKPLGEPVPGCELCAAYHAGNIALIQEQPTEVVLKHVMEEHRCSPPSKIDGLYYLETLLLTIRKTRVRKRKHIEEFVTKQGFWHADKGLFDLPVNDYNHPDGGWPLWVEPCHIVRARIEMWYD